MHQGHKRRKQNNSKTKMKESICIVFLSHTQGFFVGESIYLAKKVADAAIRDGA